jgi:Cyanobacterial and plant NDH-1 subunit O
MSFNKINMAVKKGDAVCAVAENLASSLEAQASDSIFSDYIFKTKGEVLDIRGDYALVKFTAVSTPNVWLRLDQLQAFA